MRIAIILCLLLIALSAWAGTLMDNFENGGLEDWVQGGIGGNNPGIWRIDNGELSFESRAIPSAIGLGKESWGDYEIEVDAKIVKHAANNGITEGVGIIARRTDKGNYAFLFGTLGFGAKIVYGARFTDINPVINNMLSKRWEWELDEWYHLKLVASGTQFSLYIDEELILEYEDDTYLTGMPGLIGSWRSTNARFDNFRVSGDVIPDMNLDEITSSVQLLDSITVTWGSLKQQ